MNTEKRWRTEKRRNNSKKKTKKTPNRTTKQTELINKTSNNKPSFRNPRAPLNTIYKRRLAAADGIPRI
jgi:hypothetical protein